MTSDKCTDARFSHIQHRLQQLIDCRDQLCCALKRTLLLHQLDRFLVEAHAAQRIVLRRERVALIAWAASALFFAAEHFAPRSR